MSEPKMFSMEWCMKMAGLEGNAEIGAGRLPDPDPAPDMAKHTPGPWTLTTVNTSCGICHKVGPFPWRDDKENHACIYVDYPNHGGYMGPRETELLANARLIAAAPDLLEALRAAEEWLSGWASAEPYLTTIRAAILKATQP